MKEVDEMNYLLAIEELEIKIEEIESALEESEGKEAEKLAEELQEAQEELAAAKEAYEDYKYSKGSTERLNGISNKDFL